MPLSTSSFKRAPQGQWIYIICTATLSAILILTLFEFVYRSKGHLPSVTDTPDVWSKVRSSLEMLEKSQKPVVLLGASRMLTGFDLRTFHQIYPDRKIFQLAAQARWPTATLKDIAENSDFSGIVIISITAQSFLDEFWDDQKGLVDHYHKNYYPSFDRRMGTGIRQYFQSKIVILQPSLHPKLVALSVVKNKKLPEPHNLHTELSREKSLDFQTENQGFQVMARKTKEQEGFESQVKEWSINYSSWRSNTEKVRSMVNKIQNRGGKVVFVRLPSSPKYFSVFERYMPKEKYWNKIEHYTNAKTIHFQDIPKLSSIQSPDGSHIDVRDKPFLTRILLEYLDKQDIFS